MDLQRVFLEQELEPIRLDGHIHSWASDGYRVDWMNTTMESRYQSMQRLLLAAVHRGLSGVAITDHNSMDGCVMAQQIVEMPSFKRFLKRRGLEGLLVIPGVELTVSLDDGSMGHLLGYFPEVPDTGEVWRVPEHGRVKYYQENSHYRTIPSTWEENSLFDWGRLKLEPWVLDDRKSCPFKPGLPVIEAIDLFHKFGGLVFAAHPYHLATNFGRELDKYAGVLDGCELNATVLGNKGNLKALDFIKEHDLGLIAGTDDHLLNLLGSMYTNISVDELSVQGVLNALEAHQTSVGYGLTYVQRALQVARGFDLIDSLKIYLKERFLH